jgi:hypothetical protein
MLSAYESERDDNVQYSWEESKAGSSHSRSLIHQLEEEEDHLGDAEEKEEGGDGEYLLEELD